MGQVPMLRTYGTLQLRDEYFKCTQKKYYARVAVYARQFYSQLEFFVSVLSRVMERTRAGRIFFFFVIYLVDDILLIRGANF